jgi:hypothetical protein
MDLKTNAAGTKDWLRATQGITISASDTSQFQLMTPAATTPMKRDLEVPTPDSSTRPS